MTWSRSGFSAHYKKIRIEGDEPERILNLCLIKNIEIRKIKYISESSLTMYIPGNALRILRDMAGSRYTITICSEGGFLHKLMTLKNRKALFAGIIIFLIIIIYQSLFVAEIEVSGYEGISEVSLRKTMKEAGFYEGCRKNIDLEKVKIHLYDNYDNISWVGIRYDGNLAQVTITESDNPYKKNTVPDSKPCNIVADKSGYVNLVDPEAGLRAVEDGTFVKEGDLLISGTVPLEKTTYDEESMKDTEMYVHAAGTVEAKIPVRLNFYESAYEIVKEKTGKRMIVISINDSDLAGWICPYEISNVETITILNLVKPFKLKFQVKLIDEVVISYQKITEKQLKKEVMNEIQKYVKEKLQDNVQILNKSLNFSREKNIMYIGVTLETLQKIGIEEEIIVDKSNR